MHLRKLPWIRCVLHQLEQLQHLYRDWNGSSKWAMSIGYGTVYNWYIYIYTIRFRILEHVPPLYKYIPIGSIHLANPVFLSKHAHFPRDMIFNLKTCFSPTCNQKPWRTHELVASYFRAVTSTNLPSTWSSKIPTTSTLSSKDLVQMGYLNSSWSEASSSSTMAFRSTVGHWSHGRSWRNLPLIVPSFSQALLRPQRSTAMAKNGKDGCNYQSLQVDP